jgi:ketosteroid isomerase-like protein
MGLAAPQIMALWLVAMKRKRGLARIASAKLSRNAENLGKVSSRKGACEMYRVITFLLLAAWLAFAQNPPKREGDETKIIALENLWNQMQINHAADAMEKMLDADFVLTDYDGAVMNKAQFLASMRDMSNQLTVEASEDMKLHRHGDTVVVIGATHEKGTLNGKHYERRGRFTDTWIKRDAGWICIASQLGVISK